MNVDNLTVYQSSVSFLRIFFCGVSEETRTDSFLNSYGIFTSRYYVQFVSDKIKYTISSSY